MAQHESTEVVPTITQPMAPSLTHTQPMAAATQKVAPAPTTFELGKSVVDLHGGNEPATWAGGSLELIEVAEHRPTSALDRDPTSKKWMTWAIGGSFVLVLILGFALTRGEAEAGEQADPQAAMDIPAAPEPEPAPVVTPPPEPEPKKAKAKKSTTAKRDSTLAGTSDQAATSSTSKPAASTSKPAASTSKPAASTSKPVVTPSKPTPTTPTKPAGPNLAPPEEDGSSSKAALPDVEGWDDQDQALGDRTAEE